MAFLDRLPRQGAYRSFGQYLMDRNILSASQLLHARTALHGTDAGLQDVLIAQGILTNDSYAYLFADWQGLGFTDLSDIAPDPALVRPVKAQTYLKLMLLPVYKDRGTTYVATAHPEKFDTAIQALAEDLGPVAPLVTTEAALEAKIIALFGDTLTNAASTRVPDIESCRSWEPDASRRLITTALAFFCALAIVVWQPVFSFTALTAWASFTLMIASTMKLMAFVAYVTQRARAAPPITGKQVPPAPRPVISILVPLFREKEIASALLQRLARLTYPKHLLDVVLILEENDHVTQEAVASATLPHWMRVIIVPDGQPRTKPRAMNYALDFCRGEIIGIFDAEDAPAPDQLDRVAERFATGPDDLVCLQGVLDYYNARQNWLARCFTIEYATWFRVMMPGMARLGLAIPLGGTTLYFKRGPLEKLGGWDAHNVTEDADLGFRLARHGYRTEMLHTTTREEATCHFLPWIKQRSRWLKGYMVTYLVHMRQPRALLRQLGAWKFLGFQMHFVTALSQFLLAPLLWSLWLIVLGLPHPLLHFVSEDWLQTLGILFLGTELCTVAAAFVAVSGRAHRHLIFWVPTIHFYFPLGVLAAYKALYELVFAPFYWDKTQHGHSLLRPAGITCDDAAKSPDHAVESSFKRVTNALDM